MPDRTLSGCVIVKQGKLLAIKKQDREFYELPGGAVKPDRNSEETAIQKTEMQTGITPSVIQQFGMIEFQKDAENTEVIIFECDMDPDARFKPGENISEVAWLDLNKLQNKKIGDDIKTVIEELL